MQHRFNCKADVFKIVYRKVHVPKSLTLKIFEPFLKSCTSEVRVLRGRVPRGLTVHVFLKSVYELNKDQVILVVLDLALG